MPPPRGTPSSPGMGETPQLAKWALCPMGADRWISMAVAISAPSFESTTGSPARAFKWSGISAAAALMATVPLVWMLSSPLSQILFARGSKHEGAWGHVFLIALILTAPATYALFCGTLGELLKPRVSARVHRSTMRVAAAGILPYLATVTTAVYWSGGPQHSLFLSAGLTVPIAMVTTMWASTRRH